ncbi:Alpha/Beta hydrolase protein [Xylariales sp. PMI_506]|nr:Alpha/Beta hydrolase protein [Xylariales sp. PMI_506]
MSLGLLSWLRRQFYLTGVRILRLLFALTGGPKFQTSPDEVMFLPSRDSGRQIKAHFYKSLSQSQDGLSPLLLNFHGSGFVFPLHGTDDDFCRQISRETAYSVLDVQYRLAPNDPFPSAVHDMEDVVRWVKSQPGFDQSRIAIGGFSAGGNLALVGASTFPKDTFRSVLAYYPPTDLATDPYKKVQPDPTDRPLPAFMARCFDAAYIPFGTDPRDPRVSPSYADPQSFAPNVLIVTAAHDSLALEAEQLAEKIRPFSNVVSKRMEKCKHGFDHDYEPGSVQEKAKIEAWGMAVEMLAL